MSNIDKQALNQEKIEWLNKLADMEYCKSNPGHWLMSLKDTNMLAKLALRSVALLDELEAAEKRIAKLEARAFNPAILDVIAERQRQQSVEGWMPEHDDEHCNGELAMAAVCYINETGTVNRNGGKPWGWPWDASWWKPNARRRNLVKAGALILAEIERIDRAAGIGKGE
ncbi:TPA: ead/Ea22-like family protein [Escherichia coli]|nr:ead/Ea22-like family protein [Escherichia coli]HAY4491765.1 ead/Ea22-like family protein [Escherichia coli]